MLNCSCPSILWKIECVGKESLSDEIGCLANFFLSKVLKVQIGSSWMLTENCKQEWSKDGIFNQKESRNLKNYKIPNLLVL